MRLSLLSLYSKFNNAVQFKKFNAAALRIAFVRHSPLLPHRPADYVRSACRGRLQAAALIFFPPPVFLSFLFLPCTGHACWTAPQPPRSKCYSSSECRCFLRSKGLSRCLAIAHFPGVLAVSELEAADGRTGLLYSWYMAMNTMVSVTTDWGMRASQCETA